MIGEGATGIDEVVDLLGELVGAFQVADLFDEAAPVRFEGRVEGLELVDGRYVVLIGRQMREPAGTSDITMPAEAFIRLVYGRLDPAHTPPFDGDTAHLDELRRAFPGI